MQMLFADMVERTGQAVLENGKIIFSIVDVDEAAKARIFIGRMVHSSMAGIFLCRFV